ANDQAQGTFRRFEFNVTGQLQAGRNALAVLVYAPRVQDLAITFVDWNPMPPDKDMGLWGKVVLRRSGPVAIRHPWVQTRLDLPSLATAHVTVAADLVNATDQAQNGTLEGRLGSQRFERTVTLAPNASIEVSIPLDVNHPRLWWPNGMGAPTVYALDLSFVQHGVTSDADSRSVGLDQITAAKNAGGAEQFYVNGQKVFVRGGGWTPDMMLRDGPARWATDFAYMRALNFNTVRLEGKLMDDAFFDLADRNGILVMAGWCCCDHWEEWPKWQDGEEQVATASLRDQAIKLRGHASVLVWLNGSDNPPPAPIEQAYLAVLKSVGWPKPILSSASGKPTTVTGASGVKMTGPYAYVPPVYWLAEPQHGGARGFNTETSPGAAIPMVESLRKFIPPDHLWTGTGPGQGPNDPYWTFHAGSGGYSNLHRYLPALDARYGPPTSLRDFVWKSQAIAYEGERAEFEAFGRRQGEATGVIQWMLNNGWPSLIWHLYDYYLRPGAGFYGVKLANEPLHVQYSDFDRTISVVNHTLAAASGDSVHAAVYSLQGQLLYSHLQPAVAVAPESNTDTFTLPTFSHDVFLQLALADQNGRRISTNFYWVSYRPDILETRKVTYFLAPESSTADFSALETLPAAHVVTSARFSRKGAEGTAVVHISNPGPNVAFLVRLRITQGPGGPDVLPIFWQDNYISLLPGESRTLTAGYALGELHGAAPMLAVDGWNVVGESGK
ncbi:MAG: glycosyl hydrolase family 2, partial [Terriglobales bacterium]